MKTILREDGLLVKIFYYSIILIILLISNNNQFKINLIIFET